MIAVPSIHREGVEAAHYGSKMNSIALPLGFAFCPYAHGGVEHFSFISGVVQVVFDGDDVPREVVQA
jgi:hypothetical protein